MVGRRSNRDVENRDYYGPGPSACMCMYMCMCMRICKCSVCVCVCVSGASCCSGQSRHNCRLIGVWGFYRL